MGRRRSFRNLDTCLNLGKCYLGGIRTLCPPGWTAFEDAPTAAKLVRGVLFGLTLTYSFLGSCSLSARVTSAIPNPIRSIAAPVARCMAARRSSAVPDRAVTRWGPTVSAHSVNSSFTSEERETFTGSCASSSDTSERVRGSRVRVVGTRRLPSAMSHAITGRPRTWAGGGVLDRQACLRAPVPRPAGPSQLALLRSARCGQANT